VARNARAARRQIVLIVIAMSTMPPAAPAAAEPDAVHTVDEIVVTGTKTRHLAVDAPVPTEVITREEIQATAADNLEAVLQQLPDVYVRRNDQFRLGASTVRMQGADPNKVAILLNGRRFRGGIDGVVDLRDIPVQQIERIEVIRGPASSLYGSDAMAGVINIITRSGGESPAFSGTGAGGSFDRVLLNAAHGYRVGGLEYFLSVQHDEYEIAKQFGDISAQFAGAGRDAKQTRDTVFARGEYQLAAHRLSLLGDYTPVREGPQSEKDNVTIGGGWNWQAGEATTVDAELNRYGFDRLNTLRGFEEDVAYVDWTGEGRLSHTIASGVAGESHLVTLGHRVRAESLDAAGRTIDDGAGLRFDTPDVDEAVLLNSPFLQDEVVLSETLSLVVGTSVDVHDPFGVEVNPRLNVTWRPRDGWRFTAAVGRGYRAPDLLQLYDVDANNVVVSRGRITGYVILGNPDLEPETDLGASLYGEAQVLDGLVGSLSLYRHDFRHLIDVSQVCATPATCTPGFVNPFPGLNGPIFRYENVGRAVTEGIEVSLRFSPMTLLGRGEKTHRLWVDLAYGYLYARNKSPRPGQGDELPFRPPHRFLPALTYRHLPWGAQLKWWGEYEDRTYTDVTNSPEFVAQSHWLWSVRVSQELVPIVPRAWLAEAAEWVKGTSAFVEGVNVFDEEFGTLTPMGRVAGRAAFLAGVSYER
jgi:outer membrane receptor for ferrienterochelin and colicins